MSEQHAPSWPRIAIAASACVASRLTLTATKRWPTLALIQFGQRVSDFARRMLVGRK